MLHIPWVIAGWILMMLESNILLDRLIEIRESLQFANDSPAGPITDTLWMMHGPETVFDALDALIDSCSHRSSPVLYTDHDDHVPQVILDRNNQVALRMCKCCGWVEIDEPCA